MIKLNTKIIQNETLNIKGRFDRKKNIIIVRNAAKYTDLDPVANRIIAHTPTSVL
jgi:hypothetical protein